MAPAPSKSPFFRSALESARMAKERADKTQPQCQSSAYKLAFQDNEFLLRDELRPIRLQLELLKPEMVLNEQGIQSTVVIFGSARTQAPDKAAEQLAAVQARIKAEGMTASLEADLKKSKQAVHHSRYYGEARRLAAMISENTARDQLVVITGGGPGIMEAANRGAHDVGAQSIGLNIVLPFEQRPNPYITPELCFQFHYFAVRKMHFLIRAKSLVVFPGGFGTMDEMFEALTLIQTHKVDSIPILLFGRDFWKTAINFDALVEAGTIGAGDTDIFRFVDSAEEAWELIKTANHL